MITDEKLADEIFGTPKSTNSKVSDPKLAESIFGSSPKPKKTSRLSEIFQDPVSIGVESSGEVSGLSDQEKEMNAIVASRKLEAQGIPQGNLLERAGKGVSNFVSATDKALNPIFSGAAEMVGAQSMGEELANTMMEGEEFELGKFAGGALKAGATALPAGKVLQGARGVMKLGGVGALAGGMAGTGEGLEDAEGVDDVAVSGTLGALAGGALGVALPLAGTGAKNLFKVTKDLIIPPEAGTVINEYFEKAVVPQFRGAAKTVSGRKNYNEKAQDAVKLISANKENLNLTDEAGDVVANKLPQNLRQMEQALDQTKKSVFNEYSELAKQHGDINLNLDTVKTNINEFLTNKKFAFSKNIRTAAESFIEQIDQVDGLTVVEADDLLKQLNAELASFYNKQGGDADVAIVKHVIANNIRKQTDEAISGATGEYSDLKKAYGALSTIEKDVTHRALVEGRKAPNGFFELADVYNAGQLASGVATANPASMIQGIAGVAAKKRIKIMNDKNRMVRKMFEGVDKAMSKGTSKTPQTKKTLLEVPKKLNQELSSPKTITETKDLAKPKTSGTIDGISDDLRIIVEKINSFNNAEDAYNYFKTANLKKEFGVDPLSISKEFRSISDPLDELSPKRAFVEFWNKTNKK